MQFLRSTSHGTTFCLAPPSAACPWPSAFGVLWRLTTFASPQRRGVFFKVRGCWCCSLYLKEWGKTVKPLLFFIDGTLTLKSVVLMANINQGNWPLNQFLGKWEEIREGQSPMLIGTFRSSQPRTVMSRSIDKATNFCPRVRQMSLHLSTCLLISPTTKNGCLNVSVHQKWTNFLAEWVPYFWPIRIHWRFPFAGRLHPML